MSLPDPELLVRAMAEAMRGRIAADAALVGIYTGGAWVAERLHRALSIAAPLGLLAVTLHRDDFGRIGLHRESRRSQIPFPVDGREVILVDDVLHTGRTIRAALNELFDFGRPRAVRLAALAGISVFVTGGMGGVHRGAPLTFDISADLTEMSLTNVAVISAGAKSILDIGLTLEALETLSVPVVAYRTSEFPAFFSRSSGHEAPMRADTAEEIAAVMAAKWNLGIAGGVAVVNPIPAQDEIPANEINDIIDQAVADMQARGIHGKEATPFLLGRIVEITGGASLTANIALVNNNARLGAQVARAFADLAA